VILELDDHGTLDIGAVPTTRGVANLHGEVAPIAQHILGRDKICASKSITFCRSSRSNPVMTEMTRMRTVTPSITPIIEMMVMIETKVRFGFR